MSSVLVTDGEQRAALAVVRSLGRAGHTVHVCSTRRRCIAGASRYCTSHSTTPDPLTDPASYVEALRDIIREKGIDVLLPVAEPALLAVLSERDSLQVDIPFVDQTRFGRICDKAAVMEAARSLGIEVPRQKRIDAAPDTGELSPLRFPLVIKPSRSVVSQDGVRAKSAVMHVRDAGELQARLATLPPAVYPVLLQERIVGPGIGIFVLLWEGELVASFSHRRLLEKPPAGGVSVYRESIPLDPALLERSVELLRAFDWEGVAMVEYKVDAATGTPYIMEINGRFWGSLQLAVDAGVDFPALLVACAVGAPVPRPSEYRTGVRLRWSLGEMDHLLARLRHSRADLALLEDAPGVAGTIPELLRSFGRDSRDEIFRLSDPLPVLRELLDWIRGR